MEEERPKLQLPGWDGFVWERQERREENVSSDEGQEEDQKEVTHSVNLSNPSPLVLCFRCHQRRQEGRRKLLRKPKRSSCTW